MFMKISNEIANILLDMLDANGDIEIKRNELAGRLGCVPSQINYVLASRFTPEQGYIIESRRGGGGYIRIRRANYSPNAVFMHLVNSVGSSLDEGAARANILNLLHQNFISEEAAKLILSAISENTLRSLPPQIRNIIRSDIFKQMILALLATN